MSAIVGIVNFDGEPVDPNVLNRMVQRVSYLGPDAQTIWVKGHVGLGHALFRACDADDIPQPFTLDHVTVTAHVRLDARDELIQRLRSKGIDIALTAPDVEMLTKAYLAWGEDCLNYLYGDYAFILWDEHKQSVFAARDQFGNKRILYARVQNSLIISTELGPIRKHPLVSTRLNDQAIGDFLILGNLVWFDKTQTAFSDIARVPPAHKLTSNREQLTVQRYWLPPVDEPMLRYRTEDEYIEHFLDVFKLAVKDRMRSKRIILGLSGGMDSASIAVMASRLVQSGEVDAELNAFTQVLHRIHPDTEAYYSGLVAQKLKIPQHLFASDDYPMALPAALTAEPAPNTFQGGLTDPLSRKIASLGMSILIGRAGDEIFHDSQFHNILRGLPVPAALDLVRWQWQFLGRRPRGLGRLLDLRTWRSRANKKDFPFPAWIHPEFERRLDLRERLEQFLKWSPPGRHPLHPDAYSAILWPDWGGSGETLHPLPATPRPPTWPFLDIRLIRFVLTLPPQPWFSQKYLLRRAMRDALPKDVLDRHKTPLGNIFKSLLQQPGTEWVDQWQPIPELAQYVQRDAVPPLSGEAGSINPGINLRPLGLNEWLTHYRDV